VTDSIALRGIRVFAHHGVLPEEAVDGQVFVIDLVLRMDLAPPGRSDDLEETVDYGELARRVHDVVARERWDLIERVAERVAEVILTDPRVKETEVTVHKPDAPVTVPFDDVAVTLVRRP
jgi:dihydroneopterin aldolase